MPQPRREPHLAHPPLGPATARDAWRPRRRRSPRLSRGGDRDQLLELGQLAHAHGVVDEAHALEGDAVDRAVVLADAAVGAPVVVDEDLALVATGHRVAARGLADQGVATRRALPVLPEHDDVY